ncbi:MAG: DUF3054 domain-containing protein [Halanaeroarchaeum sp.]
MNVSVDSGAIRRYAVGDVAAITLFVVLGELSHGANPLTVFVPMLETLGTFLVGWFAAAVFAGAYSGRTLVNARQAILVPIFSWAIADAIAQLLRSTPWISGSGAVSFYLVAFVVGGGLLGLWRFVGYRFARKRSAFTGD